MTYSQPIARRFEQTVRRDLGEASPCRRTKGP